MGWTVETSNEAVDAEIEALPEDMRALYVTAGGPRVVIVRVFTKKTKKTPRREIDLALSRTKSIY